LLASNRFGCSDSDTTTITVLPIEEILIPNVFTPNGDIYNNTMYISNSFIRNIKGTIYNRWGNLLYQSDATDFIWDGHEESGKPAPEGTYFYTFQITLINDEVREASGTVMLLR
jgi:gliding motility-associated-like protein